MARSTSSILRMEHTAVGPRHLTLHLRGPRPIVWTVWCWSKTRRAGAPFGPRQPCEAPCHPDPSVNPGLPSTLSPGIPVVKEARHPLCEGLKHLKHLKAIRGFFLSEGSLARKPGNCLLNFKCFKIVQAKTGNSALESERGPRPLV